MSRFVQLLGIAALVLTAGCVRMMYAKAGATEQDLRADSYACELDTRQVFPSRACNAWAWNECAGFYARCMESKGWEQRSR